MHQLKPKEALNKAFLKVKPIRSEIEDFKNNLKQLIDLSKIDESEEHHKNNLIDFLKKSYYDNQYFINTKGRNDLVIHNRASSSSPVGVIIEAKKPSNKYEMPSKDDINTKATHELLLYYLRERIRDKNIELKNLIITNINEWFIFDAQIFEKCFAHDNSLIKKFKEFEAGHLAITKTEDFYKEIASVYLAKHIEDLEFTHFKLNDFEIEINSNEISKNSRLIQLYKILSPVHLLKIDFTNDSNTLNKDFYKELLHIIGLEEYKEGSKKIIARVSKENRDYSSLLERAIYYIEEPENIEKIKNIDRFGLEKDLSFNVAMELCITWINRILFLKLLESKLLSYNNDDIKFKFLNIDFVGSFHELNKMFFKVLALSNEERHITDIDKYLHIPYLNSSLFDKTRLEKDILEISQFANDRKSTIYKDTVLKNEKGSKLKGEINTLEYLFRFLDAYDFSNDNKEEIQDNQKVLINASVLGLIFEKINGYKDGSFFTPGFITMYMCKETIRRAVVQKFNDVKSWNCENYDELYNKIEDINEANEIINSLKICDPAVGSGHFLVSALNEIIAIKQDLKILQDKNGKRLKEYKVTVINDELIITDEDGDLFDYKPNNDDSQRVQETLFNEKRIIIENCLFGVDINPNSVKICRLRLWIELLKNAYYNDSGYLETLPNIDINIKTGNSLISRHDLNIDLKQIFNHLKNWDIKSYKKAVEKYKNTNIKKEKKDIEDLINEIKKGIKDQISIYNPLTIKLNNKKSELIKLTNNDGMFGNEFTIDGKLKKKIEKLEKEIDTLTETINDINSNQIYNNAFEWRFEFPEVLDNEGTFIGFDVIIGNPPYIQLQNNGGKLANELDRFNYHTFARTGDIYSIFIEKRIQILAENKFLSFITSNKWMRAGYGEATRDYLFQFTNPKILIDLVGTKIFDEATVDTNILITQKSDNNNQCLVTGLDNNFNLSVDFETYLNNNLFITNSFNTKDTWAISSPIEEQIKLKIESLGTPLKEWDIKIYRGVLTGLNEAFIIDEKTKDKLIEQDPKSAEIIKPILRGRDIKKYSSKFADLWLINTHNGVKDLDIPRIDVEEYPAIKEHLDLYIDKLNRRGDKGDTLYNLRNCAYLQEFEKEKIVYNDISRRLTFSYLNENIYFNNTVYFIQGNQYLKYLLGVLNSILIDWFFKVISVQLGSGTMRLFSIYMYELPIPKVSMIFQQPIIDLVDKILKAKKENPEADTSHWESEIDQLVYKLYFLTDEEIKIVEEG